MSKILERNGTENTFLDAARFNSFCANYRDGIIRGSYSECKLSAISSNLIQISKGVLLISGFTVILDETTLSFGAFPTQPKEYQIVGQIKIGDSKQPEFSIFVQNVSSLRKDNFFHDDSCSGIYQIEIGKFSLNSSSINNLTQTIKVL